MKWDLDSHTSSRSLTHPAGNLNNKPAARNDHTTQPETEPALNRFALKPLALGRIVAEVFATLLCGDPTSYLNEGARFTPITDFTHDGKFGLAELINVALGRAP